jgi:hypothetical protein
MELARGSGVYACMTKLPVLPAHRDALDRVTIATPCDVAWESLRGDDRVRHCTRCGQDVYNVAAMDRDEALRLLDARTGLPCLRLYRRMDGTIVTADCWSRLRAARGKGLFAFVAALVVAGWAELCAIVVGLHALRRLRDPADPPLPSPAASAPAAMCTGPEISTLPAPGVSSSQPAAAPAPPKPPRKLKLRLPRERRYWTATLGVPAAADATIDSPAARSRR